MVVCCEEGGGAGGWEEEGVMIGRRGYDDIVELDDSSGRNEVE